MKILKGKKNGSKKNGEGAEVLGGSADFNVADYFEDMFPSMGHTSVVKDFLEPGKDFTTSLFRSVVTDEKLGNAILRLHNRHVKFDDKVHDDMLINKLAELVARYGRARLEGLFGVTNMLSPDMYKEVAGGVLHRMGKDAKVYSNQPQKLTRQEPSEESQVD